MGNDTYSACAELSGAKIVKRKLKAANKLSESCRFGQTEIGSFIATFYLPLPNPPTPEADLFPDSVPPPEPPMERRVMRRLLVGLESAKQAEVEGSERPLVDAMVDGMNANMCDSLSELLSLDLNANWLFAGQLDPVWENADIRPSETLLTNRAIKYLNKASDKLTDVPEFGDMEIEGMLYLLKHERSTASERTVRLEWVKGRSIHKVRALLTPVDYAAACDAHKEERYVRLAGRLGRVNRRWVLEDVRKFEVLPEDYEPTGE